MLLKDSKQDNDKIGFLPRDDHSGYCMERDYSRRGRNCSDSEGDGDGLTQILLISMLKLVGFKIGFRGLASG